MIWAPERKVGNVIYRNKPFCPGCETADIDYNECLKEFSGWFLDMHTFICHITKPIVQDLE